MKSEKKYELSSETMFVPFLGKSYQVRQVRALKDFQTATGVKVSKGALGGWVESEKNLSQEGNCWIDTVSSVLGNASIVGSVYLVNSTIADNSLLSGQIYVESSTISGDSKVSGNQSICWSFLNSVLIHPKNEISEQPICFEDVDFKSSTIYTTKGATFLRVKGNHIELDCDSDFVKIENVHFGDDTFIRFFGEYNAIKNLKKKPGTFHSKSCSMRDSQIIGVRKIESEELNLINSSLLGKIQISGRMILFHATIQDYAKVINHSKFSQRIHNATIKDMAVVEFESSIRRDGRVHRLNLVQDEHEVHS